jgi:hypothetical protein
VAAAGVELRPPAAASPRQAERLYSSRLNRPRSRRPASDK